MSWVQSPRRASLSRRRVFSTLQPKRAFPAPSRFFFSDVLCREDQATGSDAAFPILAALSACVYQQWVRRKISPGYLEAVPVVALIIVFGWAAWERFRLPLVPFADDDVWAYLRLGLDGLLGQRLREWFGQCFLYPWFLYVTLLVAGSFKFIALLQSLLGLATGALLYACWMQLRRFVPAPAVPTWVFKLFGIELVGVYLFCTTTIEFERSLRPESIFPFIVSLQIYCNLHFIRDRFLERRAGARSILCGSLAVFLSIAAVLLKPSFAGAVLFVNLPVFISLWQRGENVRRKLLLAVAPTVAVTLFLIWPEWALRERDPDGAAFLAKSRFSIHADLVNKQLADDIAHRASTPYSAEVLSYVHTRLTAALNESRLQAKYWPVLGFNPDYLRYGTDGRHSFVQELTDRLGGENQSAEFCRYYYWRAVTGQIDGMVAKVARELGVFYQVGRCPAYNTRHMIDVAEAYRRTARVIAAGRSVPQCAPFASFLAFAETLSSSGLQIGPYLITRWISGFLSVTHLVWCVWAVALFLLTRRMQPLHAFLGMAPPLLLLLHTYNLGTVLTLAIGHSLDVGRYSQYQLAYTLLPDFASMWLALEVFVFVRRLK